jgi:pyruvate,orthophosphate dikinase
VVFDSAQAAAAGHDVILVRRETNPDDLPGMIAAKGILTSRGGKTSHAAVAARGMGRTCVCGAEALLIDADSGTFTVDGTVVHAGDVISVDGMTGRVYLGAVPVQASPVARYLEGDADAVRARSLGACGIGLCRTEHMLLGERRQLIERLILADGGAERDTVLAQLLTLQRADFVDILAAMDGLPVTVRLLDPPLHEFLPVLEDRCLPSAGRAAGVLAPECGVRLIAATWLNKVSAS